MNIPVDEKAIRFDHIPLKDLKNELLNCDEKDSNLKRMIRDELNNRNE